MPARALPQRLRLRSMGKYLHPRERVVTEIRHHGIVLVKPVGIFVLTALLVLWIDASVPVTSDGSLTRLALAVSVAAFGYMMWQVFEWRHTRFVVTNKRIMLFHGWVTRRVSMMPLQKVTDMSYNLTIPGRLLRYGHFVLESAGQDQAFSRIAFVPDPDAHYREIIGQIFGLEGPEGSDEAKGERRVDGRHDDDPDDGGWEEQDGGRHPRERVGMLGRLPDQPDDDYGPHVLASSRDPGEGSIYRSPDLVRRDRRSRRGDGLDDTGELPPYDPGRRA